MRLGIYSIQFIQFRYIYKNKVDTKSVDIVHKNKTDTKSQIVDILCTEKNDDRHDDSQTGLKISLQ